MNNRTNTKHSKSSRLARIERKCDIILSELSAIRNSGRPDRCSIDESIERMHIASRRMRAEAEHDARVLRKMFLFK